MKESVRLGAAFIGLIVGAGFASGQEILQFFTSFGYWGIAGGIAATLLFAFIGMNLARLGSRMKTTSHKAVIYKICGKPLGVIVDGIVTFFLFGVAVVMFSGAGAIFEEQFGIPAIAGSALMVVLTIFTVLLDVRKVMALISAVTPFLIVLVVLLAGYSVFTSDITSAEITKLSSEQPAAASNWLVGGLLYVSYNIAAGAAMLTVMGGTVKDSRQAALGGALGGLGLGLLILFINLALLTKLDAVGGSSMPMLALANEMSPALGIIMSVVLLGMIYNTAVGMLYAFSARITEQAPKRFKGAVVLFGVGGFALSFFGFVTLVGTVYPVTGYLGFILIGAVVVNWVRSLTVGMKARAELQ